MARVRIAEAAKADLRAIYRFGVKQFGVKRADLYQLSLRQAIKELGEFPDAFPMRGGLRQRFRVRPHASHLIVYVADDGVHVLRVRHGAEDWTPNPAGEHR